MLHKGGVRETDTKPGPREGPITALAVEECWLREELAGARRPEEREGRPVAEARVLGSDLALARELPKDTAKVQHAWRGLSRR